MPPGSQIGTTTLRLPFLFRTKHRSPGGIVFARFRVAGMTAISRDG
jgi:hypothetical protein